jgi:predicted RNA-binding Zn-ribbon protein involved in translation (DUF1610 family)
MPLDPSHLDRMLGQPWRHKTPPTCPECGYNLTGLTSNRCPECGTSIQRKEVEQLAREAAMQAVWLRGINDVPRAGLWVGVFAGILLGAVWAGGYPGLARVAGFMGGFAAFALGLSVLRALRVSAEVVETLSQKPNYALGFSVAGLGALLVAVSIIL